MEYKKYSFYCTSFNKTVSTSTVTYTATSGPYLKEEKKTFVTQILRKHTTLTKITKKAEHY